jgi:hypothetical protein
MSNPIVLTTGSFLVNCGYYSFYYGIFINTCDLLMTDPNKTSEKYLLPNSLKSASGLIIWYESLFKIFYGGVCNGLVGLTWPVSIPLIQFWYRHNSNKPTIQEDKDPKK